MATDKSDPGKLTAKQEKFCLEYMVDLNATQAAIRAEYSAKTAKQIGTENLSKPVIAERIAKMKAEAAARTEITVDYLLEGLREIKERCLQGEPVTDRDGNETGEWKFDASGANRAIELMGKHVGAWTERREVKHSYDVSNLSDQELSAIINGKKS